MKEDRDIVERLEKSTPYGLEDYMVLIDAAAEIRRLRNLIQGVVE